MPGSSQPSRASSSASTSGEALLRAPIAHWKTRNLFQRPNTLMKSITLGQPRSVTRRVSAVFMDGPPSCQPSLATSSITVSKIPASRTYGELGMTSERQYLSRKSTPTSIQVPKSSITTTYNTAIVVPGYPQHDENVRPRNSTDVLPHRHKNSFDIAAAKLNAKNKQREISALPKSSTLGVFSNLTASLSRNSLSKFTRATSISSLTENEGSFQASSRRSSITGSRALLGNPQQIDKAQPSAYWTGRFVALRDRFRDEMLLPTKLTTIVNAHAEPSSVPDSKKQHEAIPISTDLGHNRRRASKKPTCKSRTIFKDKSRSARNSIDAALINDETNRARRVFSHLETLCITSEARKSLHAWQQAYARQMRKDDLLPRGGSMEDRSWVGRLLGHSGHETGKRGSVVYDARERDGYQAM